MMGSMCCIAGLVPAQHARFLCPPSQANSPIMALRRSPPLDTSMAHLGLDTGAVGRGSALLQFTRCGTLEVMALPRSTGASTQPSAPEKDQPAPTDSPSDAPKIALPKNLAQTLRFLSDDDLETLRGSVDSELERRRRFAHPPEAMTKAIDFPNRNPSRTRRCRALAMVI
jgi:hypothetical protein